MNRSVAPFVLLIGLACPGRIAAETLPICEPGAMALEPDLRFGAEDEDEPGFLFRPAAVVADSSGNVFVLDHALQSIVKFDSSGKHLRTFSRTGEGPGELRGAFLLERTPKDRIVAYDQGNRRLTFFGNDGQYLRSVSTAAMGYDFIARFRVTAGESLYMEIHKIDFSGASAETVMALARFSLDLESKTVIDELPVRDNVTITRPVRTNVPVPFPPRLYWDVAPSGELVVGHSGDYTLKFFSAAGELRKTVRHEGSREAVTADDREEHFAGITTTVGETVSHGAPKHIRNATKFPRYKPYFRSLRIDTAGNVLVLTFRSEGERSLYDVFDSDGRYLCSAALPATLDSGVVAGEYLYRFTTSDDDLAFVQRYRFGN